MSKLEKLNNWKVAKNGLYSTIALFISVVLGFINRRVFTETLGVEYLGFNGLFSNVFGVLTITESGFISAILYLLYKEHSKENWEEISRLMELYKVFYRLVAIATAILGVATTFFLKYIIKDNTSDWNYIYLVYLIQLLSNIVIYLLSYKRTIFLVTQKHYKYAVSDILCKIGMNIIQIIVMWAAHSYIGYLIIGAGYNVISNVVVGIMYSHEFPQIHKAKVSFNYFREKGFVKNLKAGFISNIAGIVYTATDSIVISAVLGVNYVGLYSNYLMVISFVQQVITSISSGIAPAIGNYVYSRKYDDVYKLYRNLNVMYYLIALFVTSGFLCLFQPFISLWLGSDYLIPFDAVVAISINQYIAWNHTNVLNFRSSWGEMNRDRNFFAASAICNIILSIWLGKEIGLVGVVIGTIVGHILIWIGRSYVVNTFIIKNDVKRYVLSEFAKAIFAIIIVSILYFITNLCGNGIVGLLIKCIVLVVYLCIVSLSICLLTSEGKDFYSFIRNKISEVKE